MYEIEMFKRHYCLNRLLWIYGPEGARRVRLAYELLKACSVHESEIVVMDANQFIDVCNNPIQRMHLFDHHAVIIKNIQNRAELIQLFSSMRSIRKERFRTGLRVLLVSSISLAPFLTEKWFQIQLPQEVSSPEQLDFRIHALIEEASRVNEKKICEVSARAASWLEQLYLESTEEEFMELLVLVISRTKGEKLSEAEFFHFQPDFLEADVSNN